MIIITSLSTKDHQPLKHILVSVENNQSIICEWKGKKKKYCILDDDIVDFSIVLKGYKEQRWF